VSDDGEFDRHVREVIARAIRDEGHIPTIAEIAAGLGRDASDVDRSFARMIEGHVFIPRHGSREIHAYNPFCAEPTAFAVTAGGCEWWGICAWDALGIPAALGTTGTIEARCADCDEPVRVEVGLGGAASGPPGTVMQVVTPARDFWKDIYDT
jgi:hypothetical protein